MEIKLIGGSCNKSFETLQNIKDAVLEMALDAKLEDSRDITELSKYGAKRTPALIVDNKVLSSGKYLEKEDAKRILGKVVNCK